MALLPKNEPMEKDITPKVFFIWGQSMHGKTFLARRFPNIVLLNTDGNGKKTTTPHVDISDFETFVAVLNEIEQGKHGYDTIGIDLIDDIKTFLEIYVCKKLGVDNISDAAFGKGYTEVKSTWKRLMIRLSKLPYNIVYISHIIQTTDENDSNIVIEQPSLEQKYLNMTKGRTDVMIKCQKIGKTYLQICNEKRELYTKSDFTDDKLVDALKNVKQLFEDNKPEIKETKPIAKTVMTPTIKKEMKPIAKTVMTKIEKLDVAETIEPVVLKNTDVVDVTSTLKQLATQRKSLLIKKEEE